MRTFRRALIAVLVAALTLLGASVVTWADSDTELPGITIIDERPNGCVDCHKNTTGELELRMDIAMKAVNKHPDVTRIARTIPDDCLMCHKEDAPAGALGPLTHLNHYSDPDENEFVEEYQGQCLNCHALNTATGEMTNKSGPKNW